MLTLNDIKLNVNDRTLSTGSGAPGPGSHRTQRLSHRLRKDLAVRLNVPVGDIEFERLQHHQGQIGVITALSLRGETATVLFPDGVILPAVLTQMLTPALQCAPRALVPLRA